MTSAIGNTTTTRGFTLDRFEQEVAGEIGVGKDRLHTTGRQGTLGNQTATQTGTQTGTRTGSEKTDSGTTTTTPDSDRK